MEASEKALQKTNKNYDSEYRKFKEESDKQITANEERISKSKKESKNQQVQK